MGHRDESQHRTTPNSQRDAIRDWELEEVLDQALSQLNSGDDLEHILARYPAHAGLLRPMLRAAQWVRRFPPLMPDAAARQAGLRRLLTAVETQRNAHIATLLDSAIAHLRAGEPLEAILADYPTWADVLRPMLEAAVAVSETPYPIPDLQKKREGCERLLQAVATWGGLSSASAEALSDTFEEALDEALTWLRNGADVETVLTRYPAFAAHMRPFLEVAQEIQGVPPPIPDEEAYFAGRARVVKLAARRRRQRARPGEGILKGLPDLPARLAGFAPRLRRAAITVVMLAAMILGSFSVTQVAADSLPTSPLYGVKRFTERVQLVLTPSTEAKAKLHLRFSQERLREAEKLARQTGKLDAELLDEMLKENDQYLGIIKKEVPRPEQRQELSADGVQVFRQQRRVLNELIGADSPLSPSERAALRHFAGQAGEDQAVAEEIQRQPNVAELIPSPTPFLLPTATPRPSPTPEPTKIQQPVHPTAVPAATATPLPPTAVAELAMPAVPPQPLMPTTTTTRTPAATATAVAESVHTPVPVQPTATPTSEPPATPIPTTPAVEPSPTMEIELPTLPPPQTPVP